MHVLVAGAAAVTGQDAYYRALLHAAEFVVAADAAGEWCVALGRVPDMAVGDFDSAEHGAANRLAAAGVDVKVFSVDKDASDLDLALDAARGMRVDRVTFTAAFSARLDHTLAAFGTVARACDLLAEIDEPHVAGWVLDAAYRREITLTGPHGALVSVLALDGAADRVDINGMRFDVASMRLAPLSSLGLSNQLTGERARVSVGRGRLLVLSSGEPADRAFASGDSRGAEAV